MTIRHLKIFLAVCEDENLTRTAKRLFMTQPAVTVAVKELEEQLGVQLFDRIARKLYLNGTGRLFLEKAKRLMELYEDLEHGAALLEEAAPVRVGSSITIANYMLPKACAKFAGRYPKTPLTVAVDNARGVETMLLENRVDIGLIEGAVKQEQLEKQLLVSYPICLACLPQLKDQPETLEDLVHSRLLLREKGSAVRDVFDGALLLHGLAADPVWESVNSQALVQAARAGIGIAVIPRILVQDDLSSGALKEICMEGFRLSNDSYAVYHREKLHRESLRGFLECIAGLKETVTINGCR